MGRIKAREDKYTAVEAAIARAIKAHKGGLSIRAAAESEGVACSTLYDRIKGAQSKRKAHDLDQTLGQAEEKRIVKQVEDMDRRGFPMRVDMVRILALKILKKREGESAALGKHWITRFMNRHPQLSSKFSTQVHKQRIVKSNPQILKQAFDVLGSMIKTFQILPRNIYNMDEKGLQMGKSARVKVICMRGRRSPPLMNDGNKELITVVETVSADGTALPPMIILKGKTQQAQWHSYLTEEDKDTIFSTSTKGWTNRKLGVDYLKLLFQPQTKARLQDPQEWRLLIVDGHNSHFSVEFLTFCSDARIQLFCLPSHTTHILQPLDVGLFGPLQKYYGKRIENHLRLTGEGVSKRNFLPHLREARKEAYTVKNIQSAFEVTGIVPFNPRRVLGKFSGTAAPDPEVKPVKVMASLATPQNTRAIRQIQKQAVEVARDNVQMKLLITKLANAAISGLAKGCIEEDRVQQLEATLAVQVEGKSTQKRTIHTSSAVGGEELLKKLLAIKNEGGSSATFTTPPGKRTGPHYSKRKVTFTKFPTRNTRVSPIISSSDTSFKSFTTLDEFSAMEDDENSSIASTIFLSNSGPSQLSTTSSQPPTPTPAPKKKSLISSQTQVTQSRSRRLLKK